MIAALLIFIFTAPGVFFLPQTYSSEDPTIAHYKKAIRIDSMDIEAYRNLGIYYTKIGKWDEAINCFKQGLNIAPRDTILLSQLGISYYFKRDYPKAEEIFRRAIYYYPNSDAYFNLGTVLTKEKRYEETVEVFKKALEGKPDDIEILFHLAGVYLVMGEYELAIDTYTRIIGVVPEDPRAYEGRASGYWKLGERERSVADLKRAKELRSGKGLWEPEEFGAEETRERKQEEKKEPLEVYTNDPEILYCVGEIHQITGEYELAVKTYSAAIRIDPNNPKYYRERARVYKILGKIKEAEADLEKAKELRR